jgi:hypothetical protein
VRDDILASVDSEIRTVKQGIENRISDIGGGLVSWIDSMVRDNKPDVALKARLEAERAAIGKLRDLKQIIDAATSLVEFVENFETERPLALHRLDDYFFREAAAPAPELTPAEKSMLSELAPPVVGQKPRPII